MMIIEYLYIQPISIPLLFPFWQTKKDCWRSPLELDRVNVFSFAWCLPSFFYDLMTIDSEWLVFISVSVDVIDKSNSRQRKHKCLKKCHGITSLVPYQSERRFSSYPHYITHIYIFNMLWQKSYLLSLYTKSGNCTTYEL